jgi:hypothetical protein
VAQPDLPAATAYMADWNKQKPSPPPPASGSGTPVSRKDSAAPTPGDLSGRVAHDERGNAVWNWVKDTGRAAIESTSRLLRKLEAPELKMEDTQDEELRLTDEPKSTGGGYDPYNQASKPKAPPAGKPPIKPGGK